LTKKGTENNEAYQLYLKGRFYADNRWPWQFFCRHGRIDRVDWLVIAGIGAALVNPFVADPFYCLYRARFAAPAQSGQINHRVTLIWRSRE